VKFANFFHLNTLLVLFCVKTGLNFLKSMLQNWLQPVQPEKFLTTGTGTMLPHGTMMHQMRLYSAAAPHDFPDLKDVKCVLIGMDAASADTVRGQLYPMMFPFKHFNCADLGNVRNSDPSFWIPLITELLQSGICPICIGSDENTLWGLFQAYQQHKLLINLTILDETMRFIPKTGSESTMNAPIISPIWQRILEERPSHLFHCNVIGYQSHCTPPSALRFFDQKVYEHVRLGKLKANLEEAEPFIRDADLMCCHLAALKKIEAPAQLSPNPSGLWLEEACQLARYAGMSDKLTAFGIYGFHIQDPLPTDVTAQSVAQLIWYFMEGFYNRKQDYPIGMRNLTQYIVDVKEFDFQITFWKSHKSGRWWVQIPVKTRKKQERHRLIPCSYNDYLSACRDELPERLFNAYRRFA
jgi:formiminoglutamase